MKTFAASAKLTTAATARNHKDQCVNHALTASISQKITVVLNALRRDASHVLKTPDVLNAPMDMLSETEHGYQMEHVHSIALSVRQRMDAMSVVTTYVRHANQVTS